MAVFPVTNTFCEVTYDSDWYADDRHITPYRYSLLRNDTDTSSDTVSLTLPSYTYYEYLRSLYDCRTTATGRIPPGYPGSSAGNVNENPERARTWHAFGMDARSEFSRAAIRSEPTKIRPTYPFPSLHLIQGGDSGDEYDEDYAFMDKSKQKLVWVDALNKWVPESQLQPRPYMSFIGNAPVIEKSGRPSLHRETDQIRASSEYSQRPDVHSYISVVNNKEIGLVSSRSNTFGGGDDVNPSCERFEVHMGKRASVPQSLPKPATNQRNNEKREAIKKRAQELAEQRKRRTAYSTPLYASMTERTNKKRAQSSKVVNTRPASPVQPKETPPAPRPPREAWQPTDKDKVKVKTPPKPPVVPIKKEVSITLVKAEVTEQEHAEQLDTSRDKKVKFNGQTNAKKEVKSPKKKKDQDGVSVEEMEAKLAQQRLKESLEKQRQEQILEQQRILKERELQQEKERKERDRLEEEERLQKLKTLEKKPLSQKNINHENYYENTMNIADHLFSQEDQTLESKENETKNVKKTSEIKNKKNSDLKPVPQKVKSKNTINKSMSELVDKKQADTVIDSTEKAKDLEKVKEKTTSKKGFDQIDKGLLKISDPPDEISGSDPPDKISRSNLDTLPKVSKTQKEGRKQKGKGKSNKTKAAKTEKTVKSVKQVEVKEKKEVTKTTPKPKPVLAGMKKAPAPIPALSPRQKEPLIKEEIALPITVPSEASTVEEEEPKPISAHEERRQNVFKQREILKKVKRDSRKCVKKEEEEELKKLPDIDFETKKVESWTLGDDDFSEKKSASPEKTEVQIEVLPSLLQDLTPELLEKKKDLKEKRRKAVLADLIGLENSVNKWKKPIKDSSYFDELRRLELAEERRQKQMEMYERLKNRRQSIFGYSTDDGSPSFEDYGFLAKYCIFTKGNIEMYRHAYDAVDDSKTGWLEGEDVMIALRGVNNKLTEAEEEYLYRVLELTGYQITHGADFKMFSVLAALSQRISHLDKWMKNYIGKMDFKQLEMKMFKCKTLWECNVDKDSNCISLDQLCVELRAGGVSIEHELECREKLAHLPALDLLDFLTYVPLFIMIHESVVTNPLDDSRLK